MKPSLTQKHKDYIETNYQKQSRNKMAEHLNIGVWQINTYMKKKALKVSKKQSQKFRSEALKGRTSFTKVEDQYIKDNYLLLPLRALALKMNRSTTGITKRFKELNLKIPKNIIEQRKKSCRFYKGHIPENKGKKQNEYMSPEAIERSKSTRFKKGHIPYNANLYCIGTILSKQDSSGRTYKIIKISKNKWELYHRVLWEKNRGKIPEDCIITFKDNNSENVILENLELISRTENMYRNSAHNYPEEIIPSLVLSKQLENKLNQIENG